MVIGYGNIEVEYSTSIPFDLELDSWIYQWCGTLPEFHLNPVKEKKFYLVPKKPLHHWFVSFDEELCEDEDFINERPYQVICYKITNDQITKIVRVANSVWEKRKVD